MKRHHRKAQADAAAVRAAPKANRHRAQVGIATICDDGGPGWNFWDSWDSLVNYDFLNGAYINGRVKLKTGPRLVEARSDAIQEWLRNPACHGDTHLLCIDADMGFDADIVERMLDVMYAGTSTDKPIHCLGGLCFAGNENKMHPTIYEPNADDPTGAKFQPQPMARLRGEWVVDELGELVDTWHFEGSPYPRNQLVKVLATGAACIMVSREALLHMTANWPNGYGTHPTTGQRNPYPWFVEGVDTASGHTYGEDIAFCQRLKALGYATYVDTSIKLTHWKVGALLSEPMWDLRLRAAYPDTWRDKIVAPPQKELVLS